MDAAVSSPGFWWMKPSKSIHDNDDNNQNITSTPKQTDDPSTISSSLREFLEKERALQLQSPDADTDIGSIIEEINKLAAESPLGPYEMRDFGDRSVDDIMREAEKIYLESSKSFEQLSARSRTSANLTISFNDSPKSTPTPKSASPLPLDSVQVEAAEEESYSEDFVASDLDSPEDQHPPDLFEDQLKLELLLSTSVHSKFDDKNVNFGNEIAPAAGDVDKLEEENKNLLETIATLQVQLTDTNDSLAKTRASLFTEALKSPEINIELEKAFEQLKDTKETNTALQVQLDGLNKTHQYLRASYEELLTSSKSLEQRLVNAESALASYKSELQNVQDNRDKLLESETNLAKQLEIEKLQAKSLRLQNEKDARCIQDLNRQVKEMERIISRKHPDSVSALIVAAKSDQSENNLSARRLLEDRIKNLEGEVTLRDQQSSKVFLEVQEKFSEMKTKYESHIEDLEVHVNDLKDQLKRKIDTFDVYTQTIFDDQKIPAKETKDAGVQTRMQVPRPISIKKPEKSGVEVKEDAHLLATIRGLQADLVNKEKVASKLQKELDEAKKTNKRLQKEREGSLKNIAERRGEFRSYPERLASHLKSDGDVVASSDLEEDLCATKTERDKMRIQLCRIEEDYQNLKEKRLFDLSTLQHAHEDEIQTYINNVTPLQEQLAMHHVTINSLQEQLRVAQEQLEERDDVYNNAIIPSPNGNEENLSNMPPSKEIVALEQRYQERERRLRAIVHELSKVNTANVGCNQCVIRQQQLILYKTELDQLLATIRTLT